MIHIYIYIYTHTHIYTGFPGSSAGNESACSARDCYSIPGSGRSPGEGIGYPLHYSWASLVAQMVKNPPAVWETWVCLIPGCEDPLEEGAWQPTPVFLSENPHGQRCLAGYSPRVSKSWKQLNI